MIARHKSTVSSAAATASPAMERLLDLALLAAREGRLEAVVQQRPRATRWLLRHFGETCAATLGLGRDSDDLARVARAVLHWAIAALRPDGLATLAPISDAAWLHRPAWRPMLVLAATSGMLAVPDHPRIYRRRPDETVLDNLCGLWQVDPSTVYRMMERGRQQLLALRQQALRDGPLRLSLRQHVAAQARPSEQAAAAWHQGQSERALARGDRLTALWHTWMAGDVAGFLGGWNAHAPQLSTVPEAEALLHQVAGQPLTAALVAELELARAALARLQDAPGRELQALEAARRSAAAAGDDRLLGLALTGLGRYWEARDPDRALANFQEAVSRLQRSADPAHADALLAACARLAWTYVLRSDERARLVLDHAEGVRDRRQVAQATLGLLEQVWGEYWRRAGDLQRSLEHRHRALTLFETLGDRRSVHATLLNLSHVYWQLGQYDKAEAASQQVLRHDAAALEPEHRVNAHLNLAACRFYQQAWDAAVHHNAAALLIAEGADLHTHAFRARYNLAELHYQRHQTTGDPAALAAGDAEVGRALASPGAVGNPAEVAALRQLKGAVLGTASDPWPNQLAPAEQAEHADEMAAIQAARAQLALPVAPEAEALARLLIARSHRTIAQRERERASRLVAEHDLRGKALQALTEFDAESPLAADEAVTHGARWTVEAADLLDAEARAALLRFLLREGQVAKSDYALICALSPATASKHLAELTRRGLLSQQGRGPATRYALTPT